MANQNQGDRPTGIGYDAFYSGVAPSVSQPQPGDPGGGPTGKGDTMPRAGKQPQSPPLDARAK